VGRAASFGRAQTHRRADEIDLAIVGVPYDIATTNRPVPVPARGPFASSPA
jgi:arginase family enzyme